MPDPLSYATPAGYAPAGPGLWRLSSLLVATKSPPDHLVDLPPRCVRCNAPAEHRWTGTLWHFRTGYHWLLLLSWLGIIVFGILVMADHRSAKVTAGLCRAHWAQRRRRQWGAAGAWLMGLALTVAGVDMIGRSPTSDLTGRVLIVIGVILLIGAIPYAFVAKRVLHAVWIDAGVAFLAGAGPAYLDALHPIDSAPTSVGGTPYVHAG